VEFDLKMTLLRRLVVLLLFLLAAVPQCWAQIGPAIGVNTSSGTLDVYGLRFSVTACTFVSLGTTTACSSDGVVLQGIQSGRDTISLQLIKSDLNPNSIALSVPGNTTTTTSLTFTVHVQPSGAYVGTQASSAILKGAGAYHQQGGGSSTFTTVESGGPFGTHPSITWANLASPGTQSPGSLQQNLTSAMSTFNFTETITLKSNSNAGSILSLNTLTMKFYTTPEPASVAVFLLGLGGLAVARRRRMFRST